MAASGVHVCFILRRSRRVRPVVDALASARHHRALPCPAPRRRPTCSHGRDVLVKSPTGSGKTLAFGVPIVERLDADASGARRRSSSPRRASSPRRSSTSFATIAHARALSVAAVYGGVGHRARRPSSPARAHILVATPGRLEDLIDRGAVTLDARQRARPRRGRPHARHGLPPAVDRIVAPDPGASARPCSSRRRSTARSGGSRDAYTRDARRARARRRPAERAPTSSTASSPSRHERQARRARARAAAATERGRALVFVRTKRGADRLVKRLRARGVSAVAMHGDKSQGQRERALARFEPARSTRWSPPTWPRAASTSTTSPTSSTSTRPRTATATSTASGAPAARGARASGITFVSAEQATDVARIAHDLRLHAEFARTGYASSDTLRSPARSRRRRRRDAAR